MSSDPEHFDHPPKPSQPFTLPAALSVSRKPLSSNQATMSGNSWTSSAVPLLTPSLLYRDLHNHGANRQLSMINFSAGFRFLPAVIPAPLYQLQLRTPLFMHSYPQQQQSDQTYQYRSDWTHQRQNYSESGHQQFTQGLYQTLAPQSGLRPRQQLQPCPIHDLQAHQDVQHLHNYQQRSPPRYDTETRSNANPRASNHTILGDTPGELNVERAQQESTNLHAVIPGLQDEGGIIAGGFEALSSLVAGSVVDSSSLTTMLATMQTFQRQANTQTNHCERLVADICLLEDKIRAYIERNPDCARTPARRDVDVRYDENLSVPSSALQSREEIVDKKGCDAGAAAAAHEEAEFWEIPEIPQSTEANVDCQSLYSHVLSSLPPSPSRSFATLADQSPPSSSSSQVNDSIGTYVDDVLASTQTILAQDRSYKFRTLLDNGEEQSTPTPWQACTALQRPPTPVYVQYRLV